MDSDFVRLIAFIFVVVGALNWGMVEIFDVNVVSTLFGSNYFSKTIYAIVFASGLYLAFQAFSKEGVIKLF